MLDKQIMFICADLDFFFSHRLSIARDVQARGYAVHVAAPGASSNPRGRQKGFYGHSLKINAGGMNPLQELATALQIRRLIARSKVKTVQAIGLKSILPTALACRWNRQVVPIFLFTGLGYLFTGEASKLKAIRIALRPVLKTLFRNPRVIFVFQNKDDKQEFLYRKYINSNQKTYIVPGSGVRTERFPKMPLPKNAGLHVLMPARVVGDKGAREFIEAAKIAKTARRDIHFAIAGAPDAKNPTCLSPDEINAAKSFVTFLGHQSDMHALYTQADIVCLPSYREGLPKALLEAASTGRPLIAADAPGSREIVRDGVNGALVPVGDAKALAQMILSLANNLDLREKYGQASAQIVRQDYAMPIINAQMIQIYEDAQAQTDEY